MDGVLIDSVKANSESFNLVLKRYGVKLDNRKTEGAGHRGRSLRDLLEIWKKEYTKIPKDLDFKKFQKEAFQNQLKILKKKLVPNILILNLIKKAKERKIKIAVATSSEKNRAKIFLKLLGIFDQLDALITANDVKNHKPCPDVFIKTAKKLKVLPKNCVVVEDAVNGIQAANRANMKSVAFVQNLHKRKYFSEADYIFSDFKSLKLENLISLFKVLR